MKRSSCRSRREEGAVPQHYSMRMRARASVFDDARRKYGVLHLLFAVRMRRTATRKHNEMTPKALLDRFVQGFSIEIYR